MEESKLIRISVGGNDLEIEYTPRCEELIRQRYNVPAGDPIPPELIKLYLESELRSALASQEESR